MPYALVGLAGLSAFFIAAATPQPVMAADAAPCPPPEPIIDTFTLIPYPTAAQRMNESGTTMLAITVESDGKPSGTVMTRSSDSPRLDNAASAYILSHYRWQKSVESCPASQRPITVIWQLGNPPKPDGVVQVPLSSYPADALRLEEQGDAYLTLSLGEGGAVNDIRIAYTSGHPELDNQSVAIAKASPALTAGKPSGRYVLLFRWRLSAELNANTVTMTSRAQHMR